MAIKEEHHHFVHNLLLALGLIGLSLVTFACIFMYFKENPLSARYQVSPPEECPTQTKFFHDSPNIVAVINNDNIACLGVIISRVYVLTSRKCFESAIDNSSNNMPMVRTMNNNCTSLLDAFCETLDIIEVVSPPQSLKSAIHADNLMILKLSSEVKINKIESIQLPYKYSNNNCNKVYSRNITLLQYDKQSEKLSQSIVTGVQHEKCDSLETFCTIEPGNQLPCNYTSGSLLLNSMTFQNGTKIDYLLGFYSRHHDDVFSSSACNINPAHHINVGRYNHWIHSFID